MLFWIIAATLATAVCGLIVLSLMRGHAGAEPPAAYDLRVYRDQLREVDRDLTRGVIGEAEAERIRTEVSRRILAADAQLDKSGESGGQPRLPGTILSGLAALLLIGGSLALYSRIGAPGYRDLPVEARIAASDEARANRLDQQRAEARMPAAPPPDASEDFLKLMDRLRETVSDNPEDLRGLNLLARNEAALGNLVAARKAQERVVAVKGPAATARDHAFLAELMIGAAGGYVSSDAESALRDALERQPSQGSARYYLGLYLMQVDRPDAAFRIWRRLLEESGPDAPWVEPIRAQIGAVARRAGVTYDLPERESAPRGPDAADLEAAGQMTAAERREMITGMVSRLSDRLAREGGSAAEWARLIGAYGVLGETDSARATWTEAQQVFADRAQDLELIRAAARRAGVAE
ncbi:c-type cytochrome biogenesis protein CcmI [Roseovarius sp. TE539]|uniref:c-type cytochrome biogenesis protein CcmI n=1 Tax=Roseovarius sp. TE539 TaxID=2249812 RepID=UPI000DE04234|nr:c-type cytochrome biogenesis protein CcmI [Roseovarius sp. TE539]RBI69084.1 c-type cytochrome biogenesis protein CcmI [Roseovarius sp. TE539]